MYGLVQHDLAGSRDPRLGSTAARPSGQKRGQIATRVYAAANQGVRLALRQTERRRRCQNQVARPSFEFREWTDYRGSPFGFAPVRVGDER
jgi:hypothetical protein